MDNSTRSNRRPTNSRKPSKISLESQNSESDVFERSSSRNASRQNSKEYDIIDLQRPPSRSSNRRNTETNLNLAGQRQKSFSRVIQTSPSPSEEKHVKLQMEHAFYSSKIAVLTRRAYKQTMMNGDLTADLEFTKEFQASEKAEIMISSRNIP